MIKVNELMIDNWASISARHTKDENEFLISSEDIRLIESNKLEVNPIPITEEWLLRFNNVRKCKYFEGVRISIYDNCTIMIRYFKDEWICNIEYGNLVHQKIKLPNIKYIHQIQNLYFALTGNKIEVR